MSSYQHPIYWFRHSAPYINTHRGKTFVIMLGDTAIDSDTFQTLIHDIALLHSLGIKLVLVYGARCQIDRLLDRYHISYQRHHGVRITDTHAMPYILSAVGMIRLQIEAQLSQGLANSPLFGAKLNIISGNFISAKPFGVRHGVDYQLTGEVRKIDTHAITHSLAHNHLVLLAPLGFSSTGEIFNLQAHEVAYHTAIALQADKLIFFDAAFDLIDTKGNLIRETTADTAKTLLQNTPLAHLADMPTACSQGVSRIHLLNYQKDGAILEELFTTDGSGTMISQERFDTIRQAHSNDIMGIMALIRPLEAQGVLICRSKERLEEDIEHFYVMERDGKILGCAALYPLSEDSAEIASIAIDTAYRSGHRGSQLLQFVESQAKNLGFSKMFALTTHTAHWFVEHGFNPATPQDLPPTRLHAYHNGRNSKVFIKLLSSKS